MNSNIAQPLKNSSPFKIKVNCAYCNASFEIYQTVYNKRLKNNASYKPTCSLNCSSMSYSKEEFETNWKHRLDVFVSISGPYYDKKRKSLFVLFRTKKQTLKRISIPSLKEVYLPYLQGSIKKTAQSIIKDCDSDLKTSV